MYFVIYFSLLPLLLYATVIMYLNVKCTLLCSKVLKLYGQTYKF